MTISVYTMVEAQTAAALNAAVAAAITAGQQPFGQPFIRQLPFGDMGFCQAMITGTQILVGAPGGADLDVDAAMTANSDLVAPSQKAVKTALATKPTATLDTDSTMAANSDAVLASQKATKTALATKAASTILTTLTIRHAAGVPTGAPTGAEAPVAFDSTPSSGGLYVWTGAAWVQGSVIP